MKRLSSNLPPSKRLDLEFSTFVIGCVALLLLGSLWGGSALTRMEWERASRIERAYLEGELATLRDKILGDILLEHHEAIELAVSEARARLNLNRLTIRYGTHSVESQINRRVTSLISGEVPLLAGGEPVGTLYYTSGSQFIGTSGKLLWFIVFIFVIFGIMVCVFVSRWIETRFFEPIRVLIELSARDDAAEALREFKPPSAEIGILKEQFASLTRDQLEKRQRIAELEGKKSASELASQVAHDIRSPLAALGILMTETQSLPEDVRVLMRSAITRIQDIANNLLSSSNSLRASSTPPERTTSLLCAVVESIASEKRVQFKQRSGFHIQTKLTPESYGLFAKADMSELRRILSNIINNAAESYDGAGTVSLELSAAANETHIIVRDTGRGIPKHILARLGEMGFTSGKANGHGFGVANAMRTLESWGGELRLESEVGKGTAATLVLQREAPPAWFLPRLWVSPSRPIVALDDDDAIHHTWDRIFAPFVSRGLSILHFRSWAEAKPWVDARGSAPFTGLFDYELIGLKETGLDIIESMNLASRAALVTSRYEDPGILKRCETLGVRVVPKGLAGMLPIYWTASARASDAGSERDSYWESRGTL